MAGDLRKLVYFGLANSRGKHHDGRQESRHSQVGLGEKEQRHGLEDNV